MSQIILPTLDGANPQGFLAALGVFDALREGHYCVKLSWKFDGKWRAVLHTSLSLHDIITQLEKDRDRVLNSVSLNFEFSNEDVNAPPKEYRSFLEFVPFLNNDLDADYAAAFASEAVFEAKGSVKPSLLRFSSARQKFLSTAKKNGKAATRDELKAALTALTYEKRTAYFGWDHAVCRDYSLLGQDPSNAKTQLGNPGMEWLAFRGFRLFPSVPLGEKIVTTCVHGHWEGAFVWPLWEKPISRNVIPFMLQQPWAEYDDHGNVRFCSDRLSARGVSALLESRIIREGKGFGRMRPSRTLYARPL